MATINIQNSAGKFDFDVSDLNLDVLANEDYFKDVTLGKVKNGVASGTIVFESQETSQTLAVEGTFYVDELKNTDLSEVVKEIHSLTFTDDEHTTVSITDFSLTGKALKSDSSLESFVLGQSYTINGNNSANQIWGANNDDVLNGNGGDDKLFGGAGNDTLNGGIGKNVLTGGAGDDTYYISAADKVVEAKNGGFDTVVSAATVDLSKFANVEAATLTGTKDINAKGNDVNNTLTGNDGDNILDGGKGADRMIGGKGDDTYVVDNAKDVVVETGKGDHDSVDASIDFSLAKYKTIEDLFLFGKADVSATGNDLANAIGGNTGDNELTGGKGNDHFVFVKGGGEDTITDFHAAAKGSEHDIIDLSEFGKHLKFASLHIEQINKNDVEIDFGKGDSLILEHVKLKDIDSHDFQF